MTRPFPDAPESPAAVAAWRATYRLQLDPDCTFEKAAGVVEYLADLGISHLYLSPCLTATPGSRHGYDVADPTTLAEELGGKTGFDVLCEAARAHGIGILLDIVPNHMTTHGSNFYFRHVLQHGRLSEHAPKFDLYDLEAKNEPITIGTLGRPYGHALEDSEIQIRLEGGRFRVCYYEHEFPVSPASWSLLLGETDGPLHEECRHLHRLQDAAPSELDDARKRYAERLEALTTRLREQLDADPGAIEQRLERLNSSPAELDAVLRAQHFRLMWWKLEGEFVNYRRFFNIGSLIGVRMEDPTVFAWGHSCIRRLIERGDIEGLRVDHPDGLKDPKRYFEKLRELLPQGRIYVEKILENDENLPVDWPVDGTVGYDFLNRVNRLWMDETHTEALTSIYSDFTGHPTNYLAVVREQKQFVLERHFRGDLVRLTDIAFSALDESHETRDVSRLDLEHAIAQTIVALPIYRTYLNDEGGQDEQRRILINALSLARALSEPLTESRSLAFAFLRRALLDSSSSHAQREFLARFQQLAPAVMAKGAEDTTFYRYDRLVSCNEVGSQPSALGIAAEQFHQYMSHLRQSWPHTLLCTSSHDTKRSEDVRARISVLSEIPEAWHAQVRAWAAHNEPGWRGRKPDRHAEYLLYQTLVGAHPLSKERAYAYVQKATREAKIHTSWHEPNPVYETKLEEFVEFLAEDDEFQRSLRAFCEPLVYPGRVNSLAQTLIKITAPGVPDFYQGTELWDLTLVDPDNRRPVDFEMRAERLAKARRLDVRDLGEHWDSGLVKLWMIDRALTLRGRCEDFSRLDYRPLIAQGERLRHVLAFARGEETVVAVPRFSGSIDFDFGQTEILLPNGDFRCAFSGKRFSGRAPVSELFEAFPVALLAKSSLLSSEP